MTFLAAMLLAVAGFAQASWTLTPPSGTNFYSDDAAYNGKISATYSDAIVTTNATVKITIGTGTPVDITAASITSNGAFINAAEQLANTAAGTQFTINITGVTDANGIAVPDLTGTYTYQGGIPLGTISPAKGSTLASKTQTVTIPFTKNITYSSIVITSGTVVTTLPGSTVATNSVTVSLADAHWGAPSGGYNNITIALKGVKDANGTEFSDTPGTPGTITTYYTVADAAQTVDFLGVDPADDGWTYAEDLMGWTITFMYSDTVTMGNTTATAEINYYNAANVLIADPIEIPAADITGMYNPRGGFYGLFIPIPAAPTYDPGENLAKMTITVQGLTYKGTPIANQTVTFDAAPAMFRAPVTRGENGGGTTGIQAEKADNDKLVNIYSVQGILIKKNVPASTVNTLEKGLYIVGNEKVIVK